MNAPLLPALPGYDNPQLIAHGTTALVFRAVQTRLNRPVAIKVITVDTGSVPVNAERELATTVALSSQPHIVSIIDTGVTDDDRPYIVMEYCEGGSYAQILRQKGPLPVEDVVEVGIKIGEALHAAHQAGIVHRDVKPSNILRSRFGPALTDFGIARAPDELSGTLTREMMTPHHASPEALVHQAQSGLSDVYSLASTAWTLLVGHPPFVDPTKPPMDLYYFRDRVLHEPLPPMPREDVPGWLLRELTKAMSKLPSDRHGTALEFAEALRRGALGLAPSVPTLEPVGTSDQSGRGYTPGVPPQAWPIPEAAPIGRPPPPLPGDAPAWPLNATATSTESPAAPPDTAPAAPARLEPRPEPRWEARRSDVDDVDEGGWLGPATLATDESWQSPPRETTDHPFPTRRFDELDLLPSGTGRRGALLAVLVGVAVLAIAGAAVLLLTSGGRDRPSAPPAGSVTGTADPTKFISAQSSGAPTNVRIAEERPTSVTLTWTDPSPGTVSFVVVGSGPTGEQLETKSIQRGTTSVTYTELSPTKPYCFVIGAVYAIDNVATAPEVCTKR